MEDRFPIIDILEQTPPIPDTARWALFLRNHDELTLEMVTDEERDYMYRMYAQDPQARLNLGIRRRLAPLLGNDRRVIEVINGLLFSMPGTPVIYYGDEIGMGDNIYLGDRNGVRTPMQWSADRNAGFSRCNPQQLYLPVVIGPEYHYESVNVEVQQDNPRSLLWWMKRLIALRKRSPALSRGSLEFLMPENRRVLVFLRQHEEERILVVVNLSRSVQYAELDLSVPGPRAHELVRRDGVPGDRRAAVLPHARRTLLLVPPGAPDRRPRDLLDATAAGDRGFGRLAERVRQADPAGAGRRHPRFPAACPLVRGEDPADQVGRDHGDRPGRDRRIEARRRDRGRLGRVRRG
jgi:hypothetical protein